MHFKTQVDRSQTEGKAPEKALFSEVFENVLTTGLWGQDKWYGMISADCTGDNGKVFVFVTFAVMMMIIATILIPTDLAWTFEVSITADSWHSWQLVLSP